MSSLDDGMQREQVAALQFETTSIKNLLRDGLAAISSLQFVITGGDSIFTLTSIGMEKLMKVSIGLLAVRDTRSWPSIKDMKEMNHGLIGMDATLRVALRRNSPHAVHPGHVVGLLDEVEADPYWPLLVEALHHYGMSGRFYYLNYLAKGSADQWESPATYWNSLEMAILRDKPELLNRIACLEAGVSENGRLELNAIVANSFLRWWEMVYRFWTHGAIGERARQISSDIQPDRQYSKP